MQHELLSGAGVEHSMVLFSASEAYYRSAVIELRRTLAVRDVVRVGPDAGIVILRTGDIQDVHEAAEANQLRFIRHLATVADSVSSDRLRGDSKRIADFVMSLDLPWPSDSIAVQVWESGKTPASPEDVRKAVTAALQDKGVNTVRSGSELVLSICVGERQTVVALNPSRWGLSDWPGGRMRLAALPEQISRAEFKLEELFRLHDVGSGDVGLDLGASPGGWTRILRRHGYAEVHAVDPADLDASLLADPGVVYHRTTAGEFLKTTAEHFDIVVNDMRMVPELSAQVMVDAAARLRPGAYGVFTLKLDAPDAVNQIDRSIKIFGARFEVEFARQLQHNRHELTVVGRIPSHRRPARR
jgi:23S rRNA (cytidine2498-2'-O)-methyltransferase